MVLVGLWFGFSKPIFNMFLQPLLKSINMFKEGLVKVTTPCGLVLRPTIVILHGVFDLPAVALVGRCKQFNGKCGCGYCLDEGERIGKTGRCYPFNPSSTLRTPKSNEAAATQAVNTQLAVDGVKGPTIMRWFLYFNVVWGFVVDYMHGCLLGVGRKMLSLWFDSKSHQKAWYLGKKVALVDSLLLKIMPPSFVTRLPRSIGKHRKHWKAAEFRNWMLYYSPIILQNVMHEDLFVHWIMFVSALWILLGTSISPADLQIANRLLILFYFVFEKFYGKVHCTMNIHNVRHLAQSVLENGPLWVSSCFPYESMNGSLLQFLTGTNAVHWQILYRSSMFLNLNKLLDAMPRELLHDHVCGYLTKVGARAFSDASKPQSSNAVKLNDTMWSMNRLILSLFSLSLSFFLGKNLPLTSVKTKKKKISIIWKVFFFVREKKRGRGEEKKREKSRREEPRREKREERREERIVE
eukprot:Lithocolla_globosa_v1_NODE_372_length_4260_cov_144.514388.p1 type:complete len:466 gc:universal NODE_372_length_4260_cov_144.514388:4075-2678(-)